MERAADIQPHDLPRAECGGLIHRLFHSRNVPADHDLTGRVVIRRHDHAVHAGRPATRLCNGIWLESDDRRHGACPLVARRSHELTPPPHEQKSVLEAQSAGCDVSGELPE